MLVLKENISKKNRREIKRFIKFAVVGVIGAVVDFGSLNFLYLSPAVALLGISLGGLVAQGLSFITAICSNFIWNRYWTYPDSRTKSIRRQFVQFFLVNVTGILPRTLIVAATAGLFTRLVETYREYIPIDMEASQLGLNLAVALGVGIVMFWNFFANRYWTYNDVE